MRRPIDNPILDVSGEFPPVIINPYSFASAPPTEYTAITAQTFSTTRSDSYYVGFMFAPGVSTMQVTQLGRWKIAGNSGTHTLQIRDSSGTVLASASVDAALGTDGAYQYVTLSTPLSLTQSADYSCLSQEGGDDWYNVHYGLTVTTDISGEVGAVYDFDSSGTVTTGDRDGSRYAAPNFKYTK